MRPASPRVLRHVTATFALLLAASAWAQSRDSFVVVTLRFEDESGVETPVRAAVTDASGTSWPNGPNSNFLTHSELGGYFYPDGEVTVAVPAGAVRVTAGRGFETMVEERDLVVTSDTTVVITMTRTLDMRARGWYSGDTHVHTRHAPLDYFLMPEELLRIARAEDLAMTWSLDQTWEFTGAPHAVSTPDATIFYASEFRNHAYGHVALLGLNELMGFSCCWPGVAATPTLGDLFDSWSPGPGEALVLSHPHNTAEFWDDFWLESGWPYNGMGRELPVLAARGRLSALDVVAYSNEPDIHLENWYDLLGSGLQVPPSAGTDAVLNAYKSRPAGGVRVYVKEPAGHDAASWVDGLRAGHSFVTNYPLIPEFTIDGATFGETLDLPTTGTVDVSFEVGCTQRLTWAIVLRNGLPVFYQALNGVTQGTFESFDVTLPVTESAWFAVRVYGVAENAHPAAPSLFAHTAPIYVHVDGKAPRRTAGAGRMADWIGDLVDFVEARGNWENSGQRAQVIGQLNEAKRTFTVLFEEAPASFSLNTPLDGALLPARQNVRLDWSDAVDPEPGDRVTYSILVSPSPNFFGPGTFRFSSETSGLQIADWVLPPGDTYYWKVDARDRGGNFVSASNNPRTFEIEEITVDVPESSHGIVRPTLAPNPSRGAVTVTLPERPERVRIVDVSGRVLLAGSIGEVPGLRTLDDRRFRWDGIDGDGRRVAPGRYWITFTGTGEPVTLPLTIIR